MKRYLFLPFIMVLMSLSATSATERYEIERELPLYFEQLRQELQYPDAWGNSEMTDYNEWREYARDILLQRLQYIPDDTPYDYRVIATEQRAGYKAHRIELNINRYVRIPAYLLIPDGEGEHPAVVMLHDHGAKFDIGKEKNIRPFATDTATLAIANAWVDKCYDGIYTGDYLAQNGYVVLAIDALFWGERGRKEGSRYDSQQALSANLLQLGRSWCGMIVSDDMRSVDFLASLPCVDSERIGAVGFSMGAYRAWMLSAATDDVKAAAAVCWMCVTDSLMSLSNNQTKGGSAYAMIVPGLRNHLDYHHVASISCPKPMLFINGKRDKLFPIGGVEEAYAYMHNVWDECEADDRLVTTLYDTPHTFNRAMHTEVLQFLDRWLKGSK